MVIYQEMGTLCSVYEAHKGVIMKKKLTMAKVARAVGDKELSKTIIKTIGSKKKKASTTGTDWRDVGYYELRQSDVGKPIIDAFGEKWLVSSFIGRILPQDVGKRVYERGGILQVENDEHLMSRIGSKKKKAQEEVPEEPAERPSEAGNPTDWTGWKEKHPSLEMPSGFVQVDTIEPGTAVETESGTAFIVLEKGSMAVKVEVDDASGNFVTWIENNVPVKLLGQPKRRRGK